MMKFKKPYAFLVAGLLCVATGVGIYNAGPSVEPVKAGEGDIYNIVTSADQLVAGDSYIIVSNASSKFIMANQGHTNYRYRVGLPTDNLSGSGENQQISWFDGNGGASGAALGDHFVEFVLGGEEGKWTLQDSETQNYLRLDTDGNNLNSGESAEWSITIGTDFVANISPNSYPTRSINYNSSSPRFACYKSTSNQADVVLYRKANAAIGGEPSVAISGATTGYEGSDIVLTAQTRNFTGTEFTYAWSVAEDDAELVSLTNETTSEVTVNLLKEGTATINLTVTSGEEVATASIDVTISSVLTVSEAKLLKDDTTTYVRGIVYAQYGDSFYIADEDGTGMQLFTYNDLGIAVGEEVVVTGTISTYNEGKQLNNPEIITHEVSDKVVTPKTVTYNDLENSLVNDYILIEDMVWHSGAASATNIYFYENGNSSNELVLYNHSSNSADYEGALTTAMSTWQQDVTTVTLAGVYGVFKDTLEIFLTSATTYEVDKVDTFARSFIANLTCDPTGQTAPSVEEWNTLAEEFALLSEEEKALFKQETSDNELINAATEKYDYILGKYTDETYTNFMERTITPSPVNSGLAPVFNQTNNIIIIVSVCVLAISAIGVFIVISKKRKEIKK